MFEVPGSIKKVGFSVISSKPNVVLSRLEIKVGPFPVFPNVNNAEPLLSRVTVTSAI